LNPAAFDIVFSHSCTPFCCLHWLVEYYD